MVTMMKTTTRMEPVPADCPLNPCLKLLAGAWTPEILHYLGQGPLRFGELKRALNGASSKVLTARLKDLVEKGVLTRTVLETSPPAVQYSLSPVGEALAPVLESIKTVSWRLKDEFGINL